MRTFFLLFIQGPFFQHIQYMRTHGLCQYIYELVALLGAGKRMDRPIDKHRSGRNHILKLWRAIYPSCDPSNYCLPFVLLHSKTRPSKRNCSGDFSHVPRLHLPRKQKTFPRPLDVEPKYSAYSSWKSIYAKSQFYKAEEYVSLVTARTPIHRNLLGSMNCCFILLL